jgi:hypothetical protein
MGPIVHACRLAPFTAAVDGLGGGRKATCWEGSTVLESLAVATAKVAVGEPLVLMARAIAGYPVRRNQSRCGSFRVPRSNGG